MFKSNVLEKPFNFLKRNAVHLCSRYVFFKYRVVETHTTIYFYFTTGAWSEWGRLRNLSLETDKTWLQKLLKSLLWASSGWDQIQGFLQTCYSVLKRLYLILCRNICQVCVIIMVVTSHVCATSGTWIVLLLCFSSFDNIIDWS